MAGHEISGYISKLWQALFASFIQVFTRIFRFTKTRNNPTQNQQQHSPTSTATATAHIQCNHQDTSSSHSPNPNIPTPDNHHPHPHPQSQHQHDDPHYHLQDNNDISGHDVGRVTVLSEGKDNNEEDMPRSKKRGQRGSGAKSNNNNNNNNGQGHGRGGQGRGTGNGNGNGTAPGPNNTASVNTASATGQPPNDKGNNTASPRPHSSTSFGVTTTKLHPALPQRPPPSDNKLQVQVPVPAVAAAPVISNQHGDTRPNDSRNQSDAHKLNGSRRGGGGGGNGNGNGAPRNHGRSSPTTKQQQSVVAAADRKENLAPSTSKDVTPQATPSSKGAPTVTKTVAPLTTSVNRAQAQTQKPGLNGNVTAPGSGPVSAPASSIVKPKTQESNPPNVQVDQLRTAIAGLTFDETPAAAPTPTKALDQGSVGTDTAATAARKGSAPPTLPVPVVVPFPGTRQQQQQQHKHATVPPPNLPGLIDPKTEEEQKERDYHLKFMNEALDMGQLALDTNETPVGCVLVYHGRIIAKGMNATNVTRNGTRHAEFMALSALFSRREAGDIEGDVNSSPALDDACWGDVDPRDGHIFPYGQKLHPAPVVDRSIVSECVLYVTVEPCVMCASLLRQLGIRKVYFGAVNDKFGGTGGVFRIHLNSKAVPVPKPEEEGRPYQNGYGPSDVGRIARGRTTPLLREEDDGDGGNVEPGYPVEGGYFRDKAVALLRHFYVQENGRAPQPRKKEGRAARLFAMEAAAKGGSASEMSDTATLPDTPVDNEPLPVGGGGGGSEKLDPTPTPVALSTDAPDSL